MKHFDLHALIQLAKICESPMEFYLKYGGDRPARYTASAVYLTKEDYYRRSYCVMESIWYYAKNPYFETLLDIFGGSVTEFSSFYHIPLNIVEKWETGEEIAEEYILELLLSELLIHEADTYLSVEDFVYEEDEANEEYTRGYSYYV